VGRKNKLSSFEKASCRKPLFSCFYKDIHLRKSPANSVPAAAVRQGEKVLSIWTRYKRLIGGFFSIILRVCISTHPGFSKKSLNGVGEDLGIASVLVK